MTLWEFRAIRSGWKRMNIVNQNKSKAPTEAEAMALIEQYG